MAPRELRRQYDAVVSAIENPAWEEKARATKFFYAEDTDELNAFATAHRIPGVSEEPPLIIMYAGLYRAYKLSSVVLACARPVSRREMPVRPELLRSAFRMIGQGILENGAEISDEGFETILDTLVRGPLSDEAWGDGQQSDLRSYLAGMSQAVLAHELGHVCLDHILETSRPSPEVSQEIERQADSFAKQIAARSDFRAFIDYAGLMVWALFAWMQAAGGGASDPDHDTHPDSRERTLNYFRGNAQLREEGLTERDVMALLPD